MFQYVYRASLLHQELIPINTPIDNNIAISERLKNLVADLEEVQKPWRKSGTIEEIAPIPEQPKPPKKWWQRAFLGALKAKLASAKPEVK